MTLHSPDRVIYRHLRGPFTGSIETLGLVPAGMCTDLVLEAEIAVPDDLDFAWQLHFEQASRQHLQAIQVAAEELARAPAVGGASIAGKVATPVITSERGLIAAIESQEEAEWGHAGHGRGVARVAVSLAEAALLPTRQVEQVRRAALLHDAGKLALDSALWGKRGVLTMEERQAMQAHARLGHDLAARVGVPAMVSTGILHHHERWDGQGYPSGLVGEQIPLRARILFLAERVDSMLRANYRRPPLSVQQVIAAIDAGAGKLWDPALARTATRLIKPR
jgi:HD-GYP domain-containing protein (c-di-GMP phosphodiesterase class II)